MLRVPHETMRRTFKNAQKSIEKETTYLTSAVDEATELNRQGSSDKSLEKVSEMLSRVRGLKRKISSLRENQDETISQTKARVNYLDDLCTIESIESPEYEAWSKRRLDVLLVDYFLRNGYIETAKMHTTTKGIDPLVDINVLLQCSKIEKSLFNRNTTECLAWCQDNKTYLKKIRSNLDFEVRLQHYIELIKAGKKTEAVNYHRKHLVKNYELKLNVIVQASGLLAHGPDTTVPAYQEMYSGDRWKKLAELFVSTFLSLHGLSTQSHLIESLAIGISALKTYSCSQQQQQKIQQDDDGDEEIEDIPYTGDKNSHKPILDFSKAHMCPVCSKELNKLSRPLPFALHVRCHLDSDPVVLPNGNIFGKQKLIDYSSKVGLDSGKIADPTTQEIFYYDEMNHVFPS